MTEHGQQDEIEKYLEFENLWMPPPQPNVEDQKRYQCPDIE